MIPIDTILQNLDDRQARATPEQLVRIVDQVSQAPFVTDLLEVDEPLWGGFWQFDVISPGYNLPAIELALLRATRLDSDWPEGSTAAQYLADLRRTIRHPGAGIWLLSLTGHLCLVFAAPTETRSKAEADEMKSASQRSKIVTIVWYCLTTRQLHAGYRASPVTLPVVKGTVQRPLLIDSGKETVILEPEWVVQVIDQYRGRDRLSLAARLDFEILKTRLQRPHSR